MLLPCTDPLKRGCATLLGADHRYLEGDACKPCAYDFILTPAAQQTLNKIQTRSN